MTNSTAPFQNLSSKVLRRSRSQRMLSGVSGGIGEYLNVDATLVRLGWVVLTFITGGAAILGYVVAWVVMPEAGNEPAQQPHPTPEGDIASRIYDEPTKPAA
ncbi:PspC domain-containing protein [Kribbella deserti]|uniref:PspC domain-containing protein n=1 Tax=Kribbella deserti TaxID=1926257 RepID=A0ABV6QXZ3_9ACTN